MKFLQNGKTKFIKGCIFNEVDKFPKIHETYINFLGVEKTITDFYEISKYCYRAVLNGIETIDVYYESK